MQISSGSSFIFCEQKSLGVIIFQIRFLAETSHGNICFSFDMERGWESVFDFFLAVLSYAEPV